MDNNEHVDILVQLQQILVEDGLSKSMREVILESINEIENLRGALKVFSEEFENIQKQDEAMGIGQYGLPQ